MTARTVDTVFADVSAYQRPVDDSYPHRVLSIRSNDGTIRDPNFPENYRWMSRALDSGRLEFGIVYFFWRPNWRTCVQVQQSMIKAAGGPHPRIACMIDVESDRSQHGDHSAGINGAFDLLARWLGDARRVIGYANAGDFHSMWPDRPDGLRVIGAGYPVDPRLPGEIAHQYTDGTLGGLPGFPMGAPPFGPCDMNLAAGTSAVDLAAECGIGGDLDVRAAEQYKAAFMGAVGSDVRDVREQLCGEGARDTGEYTGWPQLGGRTVTDGIAAVLKVLRNG
ncbi:hypothetical protein [Tomitella cavernea]|uniref:Uncharacterized protein n=1 Tax=Tomitella cavernea TaxID=1387982 RepID=A0ABP9CGX7_9ACTN|nr:hypothetical protein [Tomitella cavernea]